MKFTFSLGDADEGAVGAHIEVEAKSKEDALKKVEKHLPHTILVREATDEIPLTITLFLNPDYIEQGDIEPPDPVDVIASGYEWTCPDCGHSNKMPAYKLVVQCRKCKTEHTANPPDHAWG